VTFSGGVSLGGLITADVLNQGITQIVDIVSANSYTITAKDTSGATVTANASDTGNGGASVVGAYQINVGLDTTVVGTGWGAGTWGRGTWGSGASLLVAGNTLRLWSADNFGEDLIFNAPGRWDLLLGQVYEQRPLCPRGSAFGLSWRRFHDADHCQAGSGFR